MCKTVGDSVLAGSISLFVAAVLFSTGKSKYIWIALFVVAIGLMQWVDAAIWYCKDHGYDTDFLSRYILPIILVAQPLCIYLGYLLLNNRIPLFELAYLAWMCLFFYMWITDCEETTVDSDGYLVWCGFDISTSARMLDLCMICFPLLYYPDPVLRFIVIGSIVSTWIYNFPRKSFGSGWCYSQNFANLGILAYVSYSNRT